MRVLPNDIHARHQLPRLNDPGIPYYTTASS